MQNLKSLLFFSFLLVSTVIFKVTAQEISPNYTPPVQNQKLLSNNINLIQNIRYAPVPAIAKDSASDRILDLYLPQNDAKKVSLPVFVFIHGGGFTGGDKAGVKDICSKMAVQGFAVVSINYRLTLKYKKVSGASCSGNMAKGLPVNGKFHPVLNEAIENASEDAISALKWVKNNASKYNLDINKVAISGGSAGAMTALYVAYASKQNVLPIKAVVSLWGGLENVNVIGKNAAPILLYHGDIDETINLAYSHAIKDRMDSLGSKESRLVILKDKGHAQYKFIADNKIDEIVSFLNNVL
nr:alpha/beta hydrolase [uncultured Pedobacter sp.]